MVGVASVVAFSLALVGPALAVNNGLGRVPMMGWSTWCTGDPCFTDICTEDEIHRCAGRVPQLDELTFSLFVIVFGTASRPPPTSTGYGRRTLCDY